MGSSNELHRPMRLALGSLCRRSDGFEPDGFEADPLELTLEVDDAAVLFGLVLREVDLSFFFFFSSLRYPLRAAIRFELSNFIIDGG